MITCPVIGWITGLIAESSVLLAVQYVQSENELADPLGGQEIQLVLNPKQALDLSEKLRILANKALEVRGPKQ